MNYFGQKKMEHLKMRLSEEDNLKILMPKSITNELRGKIYPIENEYLKNNIELLTSYSSKMTLIFEIFKFIRIIYKFKPDVVYIEEDPHSLLGFQACTFSKLLSFKSKIIFFIWDNLNNKPTFPKNIIKILLTKISFFLSSAVVTGNIKANELLKKEKKYNKYSLVLPQVGVDIKNNFSHGFKFSKKPNDIYIAYAGRIVEQKGVENLVEAVKNLKNNHVKLILVGDGNLLEKRGKDWAIGLGDKLIHIKTVEQIKMFNILSQIDIFVLPSLTTKYWAEQFGHVIAQAMAAGCACIGSDSGAIPEVLASCGMIYHEGNVSELEDKLIKLVNDNKSRVSLGHQAKKYALHNYQHDAIAKKYLDVFKRVLDE